MAKKNASDPPREPVAPDGGWGWVVLVASFLSSVIVDGVCFAFGIFYLEFLHYFQENKGKTAWVGSVLNGMYMIMGPIAGALANRFGCRPVAIIGSIWAAIAFFISTFSPSINVLIVTYGIFGGMGFGLMYLPSIVMVGFYFDKRRALATGIATCGSGIGAFVFAPMTTFLIETYSWKGAMWIVAGIVLNGIILGALYRPLTDADIEKVRKKWRQENALYLEGQGNIEEECNNHDNVHGSVSSLGHYANHLRSAHHAKQSISLEILTNLNQWEEKGPEAVTDFCDQVKKAKSMDFLAVPAPAHLPKPSVVTDSWHGLAAYASVESLSRTKNGDIGHQENGKTVHSIEVPKKKENFLKSIAMDVGKSMDFSMLKDPVFVIYAFSCILCMTGFFVPFIYLPDNAISLGYDNQKAAFLLSILGITNTVGRVISGWLSDRPWADCLLINNVALLVGGIATILCPFCKTYVLLAIYAAVFGMCISAFVSLRSIILVDLIGLEKLTNAFGIIVLCQGITSFVGAPIAGSLFDATNNYDMSFYVAGTTIALAGIICFPLRKLSRHLEKKRKENSTAQNDTL